MGCDEAPASDTDAVSLLERMLASEDSVSYRAVKRMTAVGEDGQEKTWEHRVTHYAGGPTVFERSEDPDRPWVQERGRFYWLGDLDVLLSNYRVRLTGRGADADRPVATFVVESIHEGRPSMTFTVDEETGLLLRAESRDWRGELNMRSEITELEIDPELPPPPEARRSRFRPEAGSVAGGGEEVELPFEPLTPRWLPAGFVEKGRYRHYARGVRLKTVYSDGLTWFEIAERAAEPDDGEKNVAKKWTHGSRTTLMVVLKGVKVVLVGRLEPEVLVRILDSLAGPDAR
jgi:negative regulator of sigma E activity